MGKAFIELAGRMNKLIAKTKSAFAEIVTGDTMLLGEIEEGTAKVNGSQEAVTEVIGSFDKVAKDTVDPDRLHN